MPSLKLVGMFAAALTLGLALLYAQRAGLAQGRAEGRALYNALVAQHASAVETASAEARAEERAQWDALRASERASAERVEARRLAQLRSTTAQLTALQEAADADPALDACLRLPLPDGLRREPAPP